MKPIEPVETSHHLGQTYDPTVSNVRYVPGPPMTYMSRGQPSNLVTLVPFNFGGESLARSTLPASGFVTNNRQTPTACPSSVYVPPTNTNIVNPPLSLGQPLGEQPVVNQVFWGYRYLENQVPIRNMNYQPTPTSISYIGILAILLLHGGNPTGPTCQHWEEHLFILLEVLEGHLMEVLPLGDLMVPEVQKGHHMEVLPLGILVVL